MRKTTFLSGLSGFDRVVTKNGHTPVRMPVGIKMASTDWFQPQALLLDSNRKGVFFNRIASGHILIAKRARDRLVGDMSIPNVQSL